VANFMDRTTRRGLDQHRMDCRPGRCSPAVVNRSSGKPDEITGGSSSTAGTAPPQHPVDPDLSRGVTSSSPKLFCVRSTTAPVIDESLQRSERPPGPATETATRAPARRSSRRRSDSRKRLFRTARLRLADDERRTRCGRARGRTAERKPPIPPVAQLEEASSVVSVPTRIFKASRADSGSPASILRPCFGFDFCPGHGPRPEERTVRGRSVRQAQDGAAYEAGEQPLDEEPGGMRVQDDLPHRTPAVHEIEDPSGDR